MLRVESSLAISESHVMASSRLSGRGAESLTEGLEVYCDEDCGSAYPWVSGSVH